MTSLVRPWLSGVPKKHRGRAKAYIADRDIGGKKDGARAAEPSRKKGTKKSNCIGDTPSSDRKNYHESEDNEVAECIELAQRHQQYIERIEALIAPQFFDEGELIKFLKSTTISSAEFACTIRDLEAMDDPATLSLFQSPYFVNIETREGWTPLSKCAAFGYVNAVQELLAMDADLHYETSLRHTAMTWACYCGHEAVCLYLLRYGVDISQRTRDGKTALLHAITNSQSKIVHHLLIATRGQCFPEVPIDTFSSGSSQHVQTSLEAKRIPDRAQKATNQTQIEWHRPFLKRIRLQDKDGLDALKLAQRAVEEARAGRDYLEVVNAEGNVAISRATDVLRQVEAAIMEAEEHKMYVEKHAERTKMTKCCHEGCDFTAPKDVLPTHEHHHCVKRTITCERCGIALIFEGRDRHEEKLCPAREVSCSNVQFGCRQRMLFQDRENHLSYHCRKRSVQCRLMCGTALPFDKLDEHETALCILRRVECAQGCSATFTANLTKSHHIHDCPKRLVTCNGGCGALVKVEEMEFHLSTLCEMRALPCKWSIHGCGEKIGGVASARYHHETNECLFRPMRCRNGCDLDGQFLACFADEHYRWQCMLEKGPCPNGCHDIKVLTIPPKVLELPKHLLMVHGMQDAGDCPQRMTYCPLDLCGRHIRLFDTEKEGFGALMSGDSDLAESENRLVSLKALQQHVGGYDTFLKRIGETIGKTLSSEAEAVHSSVHVVSWLQGLHAKHQKQLDELEARKNTASRLCRILTFDQTREQHLIEFPDGVSSWLTLSLREYDVIFSDSAHQHGRLQSCGLIECSTLTVHIDHHCCHRLVSCPLKCGQRLPARTVKTHLAMHCSVRNGMCSLGCGEVMAPTFLAEHEDKHCRLRAVFCEYCHLSFQVNSLSVHVDKECLLRPRSCRLGCSSKVTWTDTTEHETNHCPKRLVPCNACNESIWFCEQEQHHKEACPMRIHGECSAGCGELLRHNEVAHHLLHSCTERQINCRQCKQQLKWSSLPEHNKLLCPQRIVSCRRGCGTKLKDAETEAHEAEECSKRLLFCKNQCGLYVPNCDMEEHLRSQCVMRVMQCPTGCRELIFSYLHEDHWKRCRQRIVPCGVGGKLCARPIGVWHLGGKLVRCAVHGENALLWAVRSQDVDLVTYLLQSVDTATAVNEEFANGFSPLVLAASLGNVDLIQLLIRFGADVNLETSRGRTPLAEACMALDPEIVKLFIDNRANVSHTNRQGRNLLEMVHAFEASTPQAAKATSELASGQVLKDQAKWKEIIRLLEDQAALERDQRDLFVAIACSNYDYVAQCLKHSSKVHSHAPPDANLLDKLEEVVAQKGKQLAEVNHELDEAIHVFNESIAETEAKRMQTIHLSSQVEDSCRRMQHAQKAEEESETDSNALEVKMLAMIREITAQDIAQLLNSHVPDEGTLVVVKALSMICGVLPRGRRNATEYTDVEWWKTSQALLMDRSLLRRLRGYRQQPITPDVMSKVRRECLKSPAFTVWSASLKEKAASSQSNSSRGLQRKASGLMPSADSLRGDIVGILATWVQGVELEYRALSERQVLVERKRQLEVAYNEATKKKQQTQFEAQVAARSLPARQEEVEVARLQCDTAEKEFVVAKKQLHNYKLLNYAALSGHTPLTFACGVGNDAMVHMLLSHGANSGHHFEEQTLCASFIQTLVRDFQYRKRFEREQHLQENSAGGTKHRSDGAIAALVRNVAHAFIVGHYTRKLAHFRQTHRVALHEAIFNGYPEIAVTLLSKEARVWHKTYVLPDRVYPGAPFDTIAEAPVAGKEIVQRRGGWRLHPLCKTPKEAKSDTNGPNDTLSLGEPMQVEDTLHQAMRYYDCRLFKASSGWEHPDTTFYSSTAQFVNNTMEKFRAAQNQRQKEFVARKNIVKKNGELREKHAALETAIIARDFRAISDALDNGAFVDYETSGASLTALMAACIEELYVQNDDGKDVLAVEFLLHRIENRPLVNFESSSGSTALRTAAFYGTVKCAQLLLECAASLNLASRLDGRTPLMVAAGNGKEKFVRFLLAQPNIDVFLVDSTGKTALEYARSGGFVGIAGQLEAAMTGNRGRVASSISGVCGVCRWGCGFMAPIEGHRVTQAKVVKDTNPLDEHERHHCPKRCVQCPNACGVDNVWAEDLSDHLQYSCALRLVNCANQKCCIRIPFQHRDRHLREECEFRIVVCSCDESMVYQRLASHAKTQCTMRLVPCPLQCKVPVESGGKESILFELPYKEVKTHITGDCPHRNVRCRNGCFTNDLQLKNREQHETKVCLLRRVTCKWGCKETVIANTKVLHEQEECELRQLSCPNRCGVMDIPVIEIDNHISSTCERRLTLCPQGCGRRAPLHTLDVHLSRECRRRTVTCEMCQQPFPDEELAMHQSSQCSQRLAVCGLCGQTNLVFAAMAKHRSDECRMRQVTCKYQCFMKLLLAHEKEQHELWECAFRPIWCPLGCGQVFVCNTLKKHQRACSMRFVTCSNGCGEELREKDRNEHELYYCSMNKR